MTHKEGSVELINQLKIKCNRVKEQQKDLSFTDITCYGFSGYIEND